MNLKRTREIKGLISQLNKMKGDFEVLKSEISSKQKELSSKNKLIKEIQQKIDKLQDNGEIHISEHAFIRYFERVKGYDLKEIEKDILTEDVLKLIEQLGGSGKYPNKDFQVVMKDYTVTTIV